MVGTSDRSPPSDYYTAVYVCGSVLLLMMVGLLVYVVCSKRFKLNWYEKTQLAEAEGGTVTTAPPAAVSTKDQAESKPKSGAAMLHYSPLRFIRAHRPVDQQDTGQCSGEPCGTQRQSSLCQGDAPSEFSGEESIPGTPNTPLGIKVSPFALSQMGLSDRTPSPLVKYVQPGCSAFGGGRPRLATMYGKLDHTKIDAAMYQKQQESPPSSQCEDLRGSLHFAISYNTQFSILCVNLIEARDLVARDFSGTSDPYARVRLLPDKTVFRESNIHRKTLNPQFEEEFVFDLPPEEISSRTLEILLYDYDQYSRHQCMGNVQVPLNNLSLKDKVTLWKGISPCDEKDDKPEMGDLMFSLGYLLSAEHLTVVILKARNLQAVDETKNTSDPYVKVALIQGGRRLKKKKTSTQRGTLYPVFNEALTFNISKDVLKTVTMEFTVMNDNILTPNETLGRVVIGPNSKGDEALHFRNMMASKSAVAMWHALTPAENT